MYYANQFKPWRVNEIVIKDRVRVKSRQAIEDIENIFKIDKRDKGSADQMRKFVPGNNVCNSFIYSTTNTKFDDDLAHIDDILMGRYL